MDDLWYEECPCGGGTIETPAGTIICPGCEYSPCAGYRPHPHQAVEAEDEIDTSDLYVS